ncbi:twin-arginine translocation signal domain-containing protein [Streptomyces sp. NPDC059153]|uniref:twin-arginine translocation signal domain-containing protein n=1 Tax=Streptomyces sp. NPDC059153 TaxID=3346743 RepID=UPI00367B909B
MTHTSHNSPVVPGASRRTFLRNVGITGGAGAMSATMGPSASPPRPRRQAANLPFVHPAKGTSR